jgi:hypothetical protein
MSLDRRQLTWQGTAWVPPAKISVTSRRHLRPWQILAVGLIFVGFGLPGMVSAAKKPSSDAGQQKPNVIILLTDDQEVGGACFVYVYRK